MSRGILEVLPPPVINVDRGYGLDDEEDLEPLEVTPRRLGYKHNRVKEMKINAEQLRAIIAETHDPHDYNPIDLIASPGSMSEADFANLAMACLDQAGMSSLDQDVVRQMLEKVFEYSEAGYFKDVERPDPATLDPMGHWR